MVKKELKMPGSMALNTVVNTTFTENCVFRWFISKYTLLEPGRLYYQAFITHGFGYAYRLIKTRERLFIAFQCSYSNAHGKFFLMDEDLIKEEIDGLEISDGLYTADFPEHLLLHEDSSYLRNGLMNIGFRFIADYSTSVQYNPLGEIGLQCDIDEFCHDIQSGFIDAKFSDFTFKFEHSSMKAHKSVLYARSLFFEEFFAEDEEATEFPIPDTTPGVLSKVLLYMYGGEITDTRIETMVNLLEVAYLLKIPSLKERCFKFFEETDTWEALEHVKFFEYKIVYE